MFSLSSAPLQSSPPNYKDFPCKRHRQGLCNLGDDCRYSHDTVENSAEPDEGTDVTTAEDASSV